MSACAGVVILYYPEKDVVSNIQSYAAYLAKMYVIDNSEKTDESLISKIMRIPNTIYIGDGENKGIAARLNQAAKLALSGRFHWLLTMDQDSFFRDGSINDYIHCVEQYSDNTTVAMFGVEHEKLPATLPDCNAMPINRLITSGSFLNLDIWSSTSGFDEALFIDEVDLEYCYRAGAAGYKIVKFSNIQLDHQLGKVSKHRSLKNFAVTNRTLHSPVRIYYMVRNHLYVKRKYQTNFTADLATSRRDLVNRIKNNLLYGKNRWQLIKMIWQAFIDYRKGRMGKYEPHLRK